MFNPNTIQTVKPQKAWTPLSVTVKETGEKIVIKDYRFNPALHENPVVAGEARNTPIKAKPIEITTEKPVITPEERFAYLKSKGWSKLDKDERANYKTLKTQLEPKKDKK